MKWLVIAVFAMVLAWALVPEATQGPGLREDAVALAKPQLPMPVPQARISSDVPAQRVGALSAQTCELSAVQGSHIAQTVEEARSGAAEDVRDVCPTNLVTQVLEQCAEQQISNADCVVERHYRCVQSGNCRICGDHLARKKEASESKE